MDGNEPAGTSAAASMDATVVGPEGSRISPRVAPGERVGRYVVLERIGAGAMGEVLAAWDPELDRKVALKLMRPGAYPGRAATSARSRLLREAQALARLSHPNVVGVHDVGTHGDEVFIAMEFVRGSTLDQWLETRRPSWRGVLELFLQAGRGLAAAHEAALVHRDFKPKNVMVDDRGRVRVMDFGVARAEGDGASASARLPDDSVHTMRAFDVALTGAGQRVGTPAYMAPEQHDHASSDARADQFAFCVALFEALYGHRPFAGDTVAALAVAVASGRIVEPSSRSGVPATVHRAIVRGLATDPDDRHASMNALLIALDRSPGRGRRLATVAAVVAALVVVVVGMRQWSRNQAVARCEEDSLVLARLWGALERDRARSAIMATELPYAGSAADTVEQRLNDYVEQWSAAASEVCRHETVDHQWPAERIELGRQCLEERRRRAVAFIDVVVDADETITRKASSSAYGLISPAQCTDPSELARRTNLLRVGGRESEVIDELERIERLVVLSLSGKHAAAEELGAAIDERAEALDSDLLRAKSRIARAEAARATGDPASAAKLLEDAYFAATRLGYDELAVATAVDLAATQADLARFDEAERWGRQADATLTRLGVDEGLPRGRLAEARGNIAAQRGDFATAVEHLERAVQTFRDELGPDHPMLAQAIDDLGLAYFQQGRFEESFERLEEVLSIRRRAFGDSHPVVAGSYNDLGVALLQRGELDGAENNFRRAIEMRERFSDGQSTLLATSLGNLAQVHDQRREYDEAIELLERACTIIETRLGKRHPTLAQMLSNLAGEHAGLGDLDRARQLYEQALSIQGEALGSEHPHTAYVRVGLSRVESRRGNHTRAVEHLQAALAVREQADVGPELLLETRSLLADALWRSGDRERALVLAREARAAAQDAKLSNSELRTGLDKWLQTHTKP